MVQDIAQRYTVIPLQLDGACRGLLGDEEEEVAAGDDNADDRSCCSNSSNTSAPAFSTGKPIASAADSPTDWQSCISAGRRANTAGGRGSSRTSALDAERYIELLDKQKRHTGGVLASSSIDDPWACGTACQANSSTSSSTTTSRSAHSTNSFTGRLGGAAAGSAAAVAAAGAAGSCTNISSDAQHVSASAGITRSSSAWAPTGAQQTAFAPAAAAHAFCAPAASTEATAGGAVAGRRRRSKSAHAWFRTESFDKRVEAVQTTTINADPVLQSTLGSPAVTSRQK